MDAFAAAGTGWSACVLLAFAAWGLSVRRRDVSIVDIAWGWLVVVPALVVAVLLPVEPRTRPVLAIALAWALRLSLHIAWRHRGAPEDRRYQAIRARNQPHFAWKSLYLVFGLQAVLAAVVGLPLLAALASRLPWRALDSAGALLAVAGLAFEAVADAQLARFRADPASRGNVMDRGLWRYSRHPNYFGEACFWWGLGLVAWSGGAWWALVSPLLVTVFLLKVSGVTLLERDLRERRPAYHDYIRRTSAFVPRRPRP